MLNYRPVKLVGIIFKQEEAAPEDDDQANLRGNSASAPHCSGKGDLLDIGVAAEVLEEFGVSIVVREAMLLV